MKLIILACLAFALASGAGTPAAGTQGTHQYVVPACHGAAHVPGYEHCHN